MLSVEDEIAGRLQILFDSKPVRDVHLVEVKILNSGNQEVRPEDYEQPIALNLDVGRILVAETAEKHPPDLPVILQREDRWVALSPPHLLNGGDWVVIKMLVVHPPRHLGLRLNARIAGVKSFGESTEGRAKSLFIMSLGGLSFLIGCSVFYLSGAVLPAAPNVPPFSPPLVASGSLILLGYFATLAGWQSYRHWGRDLTRLFRKG